MKKGSKLFLILVLVGIFIALLGFGAAVFAAGGSQPCPPDTLCNPIKAPTIYCFFKDVLTVVTQIGLSVVVFFIIYSGFLLVTARGNEEKLKEAKSALKNTVIGAVIVLGAWVFSQAVAGTIAKVTGQPALSAADCP
jgi:hypothetical protein